MAPKRKSDQVDLDLTTTVDENNQDIAPTKKARKSDASSTLTSETKGKEKSTQPESWKDMRLDGEDEVRNI